MIRSIRTALLCGAACLALSVVAAAPANAEFEILTLKGGVFNQDHSTYTQAGGHPYSASVYFDFTAKGFYEVDEQVKDVEVDVPPGLLGNPLAAPAQCTMEQLVDYQTISERCPISSQVGVANLVLPSGKNSNEEEEIYEGIPIFRMESPPGYPAMFGFNVLLVPALILPTVRTDGDYGLTIHAQFPQVTGVPVNGVRTTFWGNPSDPSHDAERGFLSYTDTSMGYWCGQPLPPDCSNPWPKDAPKNAFLTTPSDCEPELLRTTLRAVSWQQPKNVKTAFFDHDENGNPIRVKDCEKVPFAPAFEGRPTTADAETPSGFDVEVKVPDVGLLSPDGLAQSPIKGSVTTLPEGMTINPSAAEGLGVCTPAQYESSELSFEPDGKHGCPEESKVGTVSAKTPLLKETIPGNVYIAKPFDNPFGSLLAIYMVFEEPDRGILVKLAGELRTNERTGRIEAEFDDLPQLPLSTLKFHFKEGVRAPLVTPPACGTYEAESAFTPWSAPNRKVTTTSSFEILHGIDGGPCPPGGVPPFKPDFTAGAINNSAGAFTPFVMRLIRNDGEQDMTRFSAVLPPGVLGKLAGVDQCPDSAIAIAKSKSGIQEQASPSCPANSEIGHSLVGAGVGSVLTYVPGKIYLGGPFHGDPLSVIAITPVVAGPFDVGTVVVREALTLNPKTAEVEVDGAASDPIPHILKGIPAKLRDLRVYVDRDKFIINPTSCDPSSADATLFGGFLDVLSPADDVPVALSDRFQAASCSSLGFKPRLDLSLKGGTKRGGHPGLKATYRPRSGDANIKGLVVRLPRSAFLDQAHIRTICTRVQFAADSCPKAAQYGFIKAWTPLLDTPLEGPVWLRSSNHKLPDLVFDLHGLVDVEVATRIDSARGGIRATLEDSPDAPLSKVVLRMQGAKKGLIINSRNLCGAVSKANVEFEGQNGKEASANPEMKADCGGKRKR